MERIRPRGPDGEGQWLSSDASVRIAHTRLAIVEPGEGGHQPMVSGSGRMVLSYNGEIYNAREIRGALIRGGVRFRAGSDSEVLVEAIEAWGLQRALDAVRGMFAFVCWDTHDKELLAGVDHVSMKPLAYREHGGGIVLSSSIDSVRDLTPTSTLSAEAIAQVLCVGYRPAPWTMWSAVRKLGPGSFLRWTAGGGASVGRWWIPPTRVAPRDEPFEEVFDRACARHLISDVPVGILLSGGLDSSAVAVGSTRAGARPICVTLALSGASDESPAAQQTCESLGLAHICTPIPEDEVVDLLLCAARAFDEPQGFGAMLTAVAVSRSARAHAKVFLSGDGGDEAFAGYAWHQAPPEQRADDARSGIEIGSYLRAVFPRFTPEEANAMLAPMGAGIDSERVFRWASELDEPDLPWPRRAQRIDLWSFCAGSILPKMDRASMSVGLEVRMPFLDRDVIEWAIGRPVRPGEPPRAPVREYLAGRVPPSILRRSKQGFSLRLGPQWTWRALLPWLEASRLVRSGVLDPCWAAFASPDRRDAEARLYALCMLAAWAEERI